VGPFRDEAEAAPAAHSATVIHREGDELTLEIEVPVDGFVLPSGEATVRAGTREIGTARVVAEKSAAPGPHPRGVLVRLTLRLEGGKSWPGSGTIELDRGGAGTGGTAAGRITIEYA
jgi:hypothetical protein